MDASVLKVQVVSDGIDEASSKLNKLAEASDRAEKSTEELSKANKVNAESSKNGASQIESMLAKFQKQQDLLGASVSQQNAYKVAVAGGTQAQIDFAKSLGNTVDNYNTIKKVQLEAIAINRQMIETQRAWDTAVKNGGAWNAMAAAQKQAIAQNKEFDSGVRESTHGMGGLTTMTTGFRRELLVLGHEASQGQWKRFGGSLIVLAEQGNFAGAVMSLMGLAIVGATAAVAGFIYMLIKGHSEQKEMNDALIMTNNYAAATSDSLNDMAHAAASSGGSLHAAKEAMTALAGTGRFTSDQIALIGKAAVDMNTATGAAVEDTIKMFVKLADDPVKASLELNKQYNYLTLAVYDQIYALEKQGKTTEAAALAEETFAKTLSDRKDQIGKDLGYIAQKWRDIKQEVNDTIDAVGNWGKTETDAMKVAELMAKIHRMQDNLRNAMADPAKQGMVAGIQKQLEEAIQSGQQYVIKDQKMKDDAHKVALEKDSVNSQAAIDAMHKRNRTAAQIREDEELELRAHFDKINNSEVAHGRAIKYTHDQIEQEIRNSQLKHKDKGSKRGLDDSGAELRGTLQGYQTEISEAEKHYSALNKIANDEYEAGKATSEQLRDTRINNAMIAYGDTVRFYDLEIAAEEKYLAKKGRTPAEIKAATEKIKDIYKQADAAYTQFNDRAAQADAEFVKRQKDKVIAVVTLGDKFENETQRGNEQIQQETLLFGMNAESRKIALAQVKVDYETREKINIAMEKGASYNQQEIQDLLAKAEARKADIAAQEGQLAGIALANQLNEQAKTLGLQQVTDASARAAILLEIEKAKWDAILALDTSGTTQQMTNAAAVQKAYDSQLGTNKVNSLAASYTKLGATIGDSLSKGFGKGGKAVGDMIKVASDGYSKMLTSDSNYATATLAINNNKDLTIAQKSEALKNLQISHDKEVADNQATTIEGMLGAAKGYFEENSRGYKILEGVEKAYHAIKMGIAIANMVMDEKVTLQSILNSGLRAAADGVAAVVKAIASVPFPYNLVAGAATLAAVVGLGVAISGGLSGGGGSDPTAERQARNGTGANSSFGEVADSNGNYSVKSESIAKSLEILDNNSNIALTHTQAMKNSLHSIENNIGGLINLMIRDDPTNKGLQVDGLGFTANGGSIGATLSGADPTHLLGKIFGGTTKSITDGGYTFDDANVSQIRDKGLNGQKYADVTTESSGLQKIVNFVGGIFGHGGDDGTKRKFDKLSQELNDQFNKIILNFGDTILEAMKGLGFDIDAAVKGGGASDGLFGGMDKSIREQLNTFVVKLGDISLEGLKPEEKQKAIEAAFGKVGDDMAKFILPGIEKLAKVGEGALVTLVRVAQSFETATYWVKTFGNSTEHVFGEVGIKAATAATHLIDAAGGLDKFNTAAESYLQSGFTTDQQKNISQNAGQSALDSIFNTPAFKELHATIPRTWEEFNKLMGSIDLTKESGQELYATLLTQGVPAFLAVNGSAQAAADAMKTLNAALDDLRPEKNGQGYQKDVDTATTNIRRDSFGGIQNIGDLLRMTPDDFKLFGDAVKQDGIDLVNATKAQNAYNASLKKSKEGYEDAVAEYKGYSEEQKAAIKQQRDYNNMVQGGVVGVTNMAQATNEVYIASLHLTPAQYDLVAAYVQSGTSAANLAKTLNSISWGDIAATAQSEFDLLFANVSEAAAVVSKGNFAKELGDTAAFLSSQLVVLEEKRKAMLAKQGGTSFGNTDQMIAQEMVLAQKKIAELNADLLSYIGYEADAVTKGHGKALVELDRWHKQQIALAGGNGAKLLLIEKSYAQQRADILKGATESGLSELSNSLNKWLESIKLNSALSPLTAQQQLEEARRQYNVDLAKAQGGDQTAMQDITKYAEALLNAQKAVTGFAGDYSALFAMVQQQIGQLANPDGNPTAGATSGDITQLKEEVVSLKETLARTLEKILVATENQTAEVSTSVQSASSSTSQAISKAAVLTKTN